MTTTLFSWGYFGWGNATGELVQIVDSVERGRGFAPPVFVDTRIRRSVRAQGFQGAAFAQRVGADRHRWMQGLGNEAIRTGTGGIHILEPARAHELLDLALTSARGDPLADGRARRVIFFCSCAWPKVDGEVVCHRHAVGELVLTAARERGAQIEVTEWPGGTTTESTLTVTPALLAALRRGRTSIPLPSFPGAELGGLPWGSLLRVQCQHAALRVISGPARHRAGAWEMPVLRVIDHELSDAAACRRAAELCQSLGLDRRGSAESADRSSSETRTLS